MATTTWGWLVLAFPLLGMLIVAAGYRRLPGRSAGWIGTASVLLAFIASIGALISLQGHVPAHRALACADGVVRWPDDGPLTFVPDELMDDPERTKAGLRDAYRRPLDLDFDRLLLAHGDPIVHGAKDDLAAFVERL